LPAPFILFAVAELLFDYVLGIDWRQTVYLWPMITLYYVSLMGLMGYAFSLGLIYGFITLAAYFLNLLATWYSHAG